jgi:hypothetical protein
VAALFSLLGTTNKTLHFNVTIKYTVLITWPLDYFGREKRANNDRHRYQYVKHKHIEESHHECCSNGKIKKFMQTLHLSPVSVMKYNVNA